MDETFVAAWLQPTTSRRRRFTTRSSGQYADVNGLHLYYETEGTGRPLILLHGGLGSGEMFGPVRTALAANHQVITPDLQGHGRTADIDRPIDVRLMADDIAALIRHLGLDRPDVVGYSLGGGVAFMTAVKYPELVGKLVVASAHVTYDALDPAMYAQQEQVGAAAADALKGTPMYEGYVRVAPRPEDFPQPARQDRRKHEEAIRLQRGGSRAQCAHDVRRRGRRHGAAQPLRRGLQAARWRATGRWLDGGGEAEGRPRPGDPARPDPLQPRDIAALRDGDAVVPGRPGQPRRR